MAIVRKSRFLPTPTGEGGWLTQYKKNDPSKPAVGMPMDQFIPSVFPPAMGSQVTDSEGHSSWRKLNAKRDAGGPFLSRRKYYVVNPTNTSGYTLWEGPFATNWLRRYVYYGSALPVALSLLTFPSYVDSSDAQLNSLGAKAVALAAPGNPVAGLAQLFGEVREQLPRFKSSTWEARAGHLRHVGDDYLNVEFGWKPLVGEISNVAKAVSHAYELVRQYERDAGRVVRRRWDFPSDTTTVIDTPLIGRPPYYGGTTKSGTQIVSSSDIVRVRTTVRRTWFSGAFTYHLPTDYDSRKEFDRLSLFADRILSTRITPEVLWELTPWSWAVDWFSNFGDVFHNASRYATDGLVMRYGYMMENVTITDTYTRKQPLYFVGGAPITSSVSLVTETKKRVKANPFGFGVSWSGLSPAQLSIAAALGLSRS